MTDNSLLGSTVRAFSGHEFRTPMTAIIGLANMMHESAGQISVEEQKELTNHILTSAKHLMNVSLRLSTWYELKNNRIENQEQFTITTEQVLQMIKENADTQLTTGDFFSFSSEIHKITIAGNKMVFMMALKELINNAFKFAKKSTISTFSFLESGDFYKIIISNCSDNINSFDFNKYTVFTQFDRKHYEQQGLGLGLEIARLGMKLCHGEFDMYTQAFDEQTCKVVCEVQLPVAHSGRN